MGSSRLVLKDERIIRQEHDNGKVYRQVEIADILAAVG